MDDFRTQKNKTDKVKIKKALSNEKYFLKKIKEYFQYCDEHGDKNCQSCAYYDEGSKCRGCKKYSKKPYTIAGLCLYLGISVSEFDGLKQNENFGDAVDFALLKIREYIEENCVLGNISPTFAAAALKGELYPKDEQKNTDEKIEFVLSSEISELAK